MEIVRLKSAKIKDGQIEEVNFNQILTRAGEPYGTPQVFFSNSFSDIYGTLKYVVDGYWKFYDRLDEMWDLKGSSIFVKDDSEFVNHVETRRYRWLNAEGLYGDKSKHSNEFLYMNERDDRIGDKGLYFYILYGKLYDVLISCGRK